MSNLVKMGYTLISAEDEELLVWTQSYLCAVSLLSSKKKKAKKKAIGVMNGWRSLERKAKGLTQTVGRSRVFLFKVALMTEAIGRIGISMQALAGSAIVRFP